MQWLARVFASAVVRKVAYVAVGLLVAMVGQCAHAEGTVAVQDTWCVSAHPVSGDNAVQGGPFCNYNPQGAASEYAAAATATGQYGLNGTASITRAYRLNVTAASTCVPVAGTNPTSSTACQIQINANGGSYSDWAQIFAYSALGTCPANSTGPTGGQCTCVTGYSPSPDGHSCLPPPPPTCAVRSLGDTSLGPFTSVGNVSLEYSSCEAVSGGGCVHRYDVFFVGEYAGGYWATAHERTTGENCTPGSGGLAPVPGSGNMGGGIGDGTGTSGGAGSGGSAGDPAPTPPATSCGVGMCPGTIGNPPVEVCVACSSTSSTGTGTAQGPASTASSPPGAIPGTTGTTSSTTCTAGACTTTTTTTTNNSNGTTTTTTGTTTQDKGDYCGEHPGSAQCEGEDDAKDPCEDAPDRAACKNLGTLEATPLQGVTVPLSITPSAGYGPSNASCPAPQTATLLGHPYSFSWQPFCDLAVGIRPVVIALAWLSAAIGFLGLSRKGN